jgi:hypothetical protein
MSLYARLLALLKTLMNSWLRVVSAPPDEALLAGAESGDAAAVQQALSRGADVAAETAVRAPHHPRAPAARAAGARRGCAAQRSAAQRCRACALLAPRRADVGPAVSHAKEEKSYAAARRAAARAAASRTPPGAA